MDFKSQGNAAFGQKEWQKAAELYTKALEHDPKMVTALANRAACWIKLRRWLDGRRDCESGLSHIEKGNKLAPKLWWRLAICERELGLSNFDAVAQGLEVSPNNPELLQELENSSVSIPIQDVDSLPEQFSPLQPETRSSGSRAGTNKLIPKQTKVPSFVAPRRPLTYSGVAGATRVANDDAYNWWYSLEPEELANAHRNAGLEPTTLDYIHKMVSERGGIQGRALLSALSHCPRYESARLMADESLAKQAELAIASL